MTNPIYHVQFLAAIIANAQYNSEIESEFTISKGEVFIKMKRNETRQLHIVEKIDKMKDQLCAASISSAIYEFLNSDES